MVGNTGYNITGDFQGLKNGVCMRMCCRGLTPIEEASRLNQKLKANYEARLARLTPGQAYQKTSLVSVCVCVLYVSETRRGRGRPPDSEISL